MPQVETPSRKNNAVDVSVLSTVNIVTCLDTNFKHMSDRGAIDDNKSEALKGFKWWRR